MLAVLPACEHRLVMQHRIKDWTAMLTAVLCLASVTGCVTAQEPAPAWEEESAPEQPAAPEAATPLTPAQLDQMTAPIALYSDPLLGMILTAATYPLEIVEAARWLDADEHSSLKGDALNAALEQQSWDTSVKALVAVPEVLRMMNQNLEWTEQLGDAFLSQQADVMDSIQRLRHSAAASDALQSSPQESVATEDGEIVIEPASPDIIYVPCYDPAIYGPWPWPGYPAFYFPFPPDYCYGGGLITFGIGFGITGPYWGWGRWNWRGHGFYVGPRVPHPGPVPIRPWVHNPAHRHGVPYRDMATARRYGPNAGAWRGYRGFPATPSQARAAPRMPSLTRPGPPLFQSYGPGPRVRSEASRGAFSLGAPALRGGFGGRGGGGHGAGGRPH